MDKVETTVVLLSQTEGRDLILKAIQNSASLLSLKGNPEDALIYKSVVPATLDARRMLWLGKGGVMIYRLHQTLKYPSNWIRTFVLGQLSFFAAYFFLDNIRLLAKFKLISIRERTVSKIHKVQCKLLQLGYLSVLLAELNRYSRSETTRLSVLKAIVDVIQGVTTSWKVSTCGLTSSVIGLILTSKKLSNGSHK